MLRIEDIDQPRVVPGAADALLDDLRYLGLDWDEGPDLGGPAAPYVQSQRSALYERAISTLRSQGRIYACSCTRKELALASAPHGPAEFGAPYPGTCRAGPQRTDAPLSARFRVPDKLPGFHDGLLGVVSPAAHGDFVIQRADGTISYQLAVVVDDIAMEVSEVLRGEDLAGCTGWQLALYQALGRRPPAFVHVPLLRGPNGKRLAKRDGARSLAELREQGVDAATLIGALGASVGLVAPGTRASAAELLPHFSLTKIIERPLDWEVVLGLRR